MNSQLQQLIEQYIDLYHRYSGNSDSLDKQAFKKMLDEQFPDTDEKQKRDQLFQEADINKDGKLSFAEVGRLVAKFVAETHENSASKKGVPLATGKNSSSKSFRRRQGSVAY
uniref:EF-hand domain-containing protein n=1 Tax=Podarcis muralis TaxID=64176 RepID=A0A670JST4_PODMU